MKRNEMGLTNKEICEQATNLFQIDNPNSYKILEECDFDKMLRRNTQSSKKTTNWLTYIARVLCFDPEDYKKHFTDEGFQHISKKITSQSEKALRTQYISTCLYMQSNSFCKELYIHQSPPNRGVQCIKETQNKKRRAETNVKVRLFNKNIVFLSTV